MGEQMPNAQQHKEEESRRQLERRMNLVHELLHIERQAYDLLMPVLRDTFRAERRTPRTIAMINELNLHEHNIERLEDMLEDLRLAYEHFFDREPQDAEVDVPEVPDEEPAPAEEA